MKYLPSLRFTVFITVVLLIQAINARAPDFDFINILSVSLMNAALYLSGVYYGYKSSQVTP